MTSKKKLKPSPPQGHTSTFLWGLRVAWECSPQFNFEYPTSPSWLPRTSPIFSFFLIYLLIMLLQFSHFSPFTPLCPALPLPPTSPTYSSCPWVVHIGSLAFTFPILFLSSPYFLTYHLCYLFSVPIFWHDKIPQPPLHIPTQLADLLKMYILSPLFWQLLSLCSGYCDGSAWQSSRDLPSLPIWRYSACISRKTSQKELARPIHQSRTFETKE